MMTANYVLMIVYNHLFVHKIANDVTSYQKKRPDFEMWTDKEHSLLR